mgnify:CR=1 FL=1
MDKKTEMRMKKVKEDTKGFLKEFKEFISRGNVMDLAVGVIIGSAFGKIVSSLVDNILMPLIGMIIGGINFSTLSITVGTAQIQYGLFLQNIIDFLIVAFCIFLIVKSLNKLSNIKKKEQEKPAVKEKSEEVKLLEEIRDLLKNKKN